MAKGTGRRAARAAAEHSTSLRVSAETMRRIDTLVEKLAAYGAKRATVFKLAIDKGLEVLEREHK
jgi:predicted DNA-binding protein